MSEKIRIRVPATSANLGPGFDTLGIALSLYNTFIFTLSNRFEYINMKSKYANEDNLVIVSAKAVYKYLNSEIKYFRLEEETNIPVARGLGSSATCIIAGILAGSYFCNVHLQEKEIIEIATSIEGHPDNVAPALLGNLISSVVNENEVIWTKHNVPVDLFYTIAVPDFPLSTRIARSALPDKLGYKDIVYSLSRAINIPKAIEEKEIKKLFYLLEDKLHQPYRFALIEDSHLFLEFSRFNKYPFCISGSGSTLLFITDKSIINELKEIKGKHNWMIQELRPNIVGTIMEEI